jgi:hypothetical protein
VNYFNIELELKLKGDSDMWLVLEITRIVLPLLIVGGIGVFVIKRLEYKHKHNKLGKKKSKAAQNLLDSLMPLGTLFGCAIGVILSMFFSISLLAALSLGSAIGLLLGYFAYEIYGRNGESYS